jgi:hypothetical protein
MELSCSGADPVICLHHETNKRINTKIINTHFMKKAMKIYGMFVIALLALTVGFSTVTLANDGGNPATELKLIGKMQNQPVFQLNLANAEEDEITVTFRDEYGNVLYTDKFKGANISKKFVLKGEDASDTRFNVMVKSKNSNKTEVYTINKSTSYVEETVVNKIK